MASKERQIQRWKNSIQPTPEFLLCPICKNNELYNNYKKILAKDKICDCFGTIVRHQCPNCDLIFGDLRFLNLSNEEINDDYCDVYSYFTEGPTHIHILRCIQSIDIFKNKNFKYLDYACGVGKMIPILKNMNYDCVGYDKYVVSDGVLNNIDGMKFDVIYSNNFIEHLINPIEDIEFMLKYLNDGGYLIFFSDCIDEYKIEFTHYHTFYYIGKSFKLLCDKLNLEILESREIGPIKIKILKKIN